MTDKLRGALAACARFAKREAVFTAALLLALGSLFLVPQNESPLPWSAIDWDTLALLFSLMAVMKGAQRLGLFSYCGSVLLRRTKSTRQMMSVLVFLPFFCSMAITNDVALITFVPFAITVLRMAEQEKLLIPVVVLQTLAANLGSMLTPLGNPQNLYLYRLSDLRFSAFLTLMLPYVLLSGGALALLLVFRRRESLRFTPAEVRPGNTRGLLCCSLGFLLCMLALAELLPAPAVAAVVLLFLLFADRGLLRSLDYSLLCTFLAFFVFIGNMERIEPFRLWLRSTLAGNELPAAVLTSQVISNVPAALLLSGFTSDWRALIVGCNLGGLGTLIASMASLISYKQLAGAYPALRTRYLLYFTLLSLLLLGALYACAVLLDG